MYTPRIGIMNQGITQPHGGPLGNQYCGMNLCAAYVATMGTSPMRRWWIISIRLEWAGHLPTATTYNHCAIHAMRLSQERNQGYESKFCNEIRAQRGISGANKAHRIYIGRNR
jgi:hypothetical protein